MPFGSEMGLLLNLRLTLTEGVIEYVSCVRYRYLARNATSLEHQVQQPGISSLSQRVIKVQIEIRAGLQFSRGTKPNGEDLAWCD